MSSGAGCFSLSMDKLPNSKRMINQGFLWAVGLVLLHSLQVSFQVSRQTINWVFLLRGKAWLSSYPRSRSQAPSTSSVSPLGEQIACCSSLPIGKVPSSTSMINELRISNEAWLRLLEPSSSRSSKEIQICSVHHLTSLYHLHNVDYTSNRSWVMQMKLRSLPRTLQEQSQLRGTNAIASGLVSLRNALRHVIRMKRGIANVNGPQPGGINHLRLIAGLSSASWA